MKDIKTTRIRAENGDEGTVKWGTIEIGKIITLVCAHPCTHTYTHAYTQTQALCILIKKNAMFMWLTHLQQVFKIFQMDFQINKGFTVEICCSCYF